MRRSIAWRGPAVGLALTSLAATGTTQLTQDQIHAAGLGAMNNSIDVEAVTGDALNLGVVYLDGEIYVSHSGPPAMVSVLDGAGNLVRSFPQVATTSFGFRDGATDGTSIMFGWEDGINVMSPLGDPVNELIAANGPQPIPQPIAGAGLAAISTYRGVAFNPEGNGGDGSIWTANFGGDLIEIDLAGNILNQFPNNSGWSIYGLAWDPLTGTLLANSTPNAGDIVQIDPVAGATTGVGFPRLFPGSAQGGLSPVPLTEKGAPWYVVGLDQATPDTITFYRVHLYTDPWRNGYGEGRLLTAVGGATPDDGPVKTMFPGGTISWEVTPRQPGPPPQAPAWVTFNPGADALINGVTQIGHSFLLPEFVALHRRSMPPGFAITDFTLTNRVNTMPTPPLLDQEFLRLQALTINPGGLAAITATNQMFFQLDASRATVEAVGSNSFNSATGSGFWRVRHNFGSPVQSLVFDWTASSNPNQTTMRFDTNQTSMADVFDAGNSTDPGCQGTYRNGSDVATGLIYDAANTAPTSACATAALANTGWIGTNMGSAGDYRTLEFRFAPGGFAGQLFEFDVDTDGGQGIDGGAMEGMVVTITLEDGTVLSGELAVDPANSLRSFIRFM